MLHGFIDTMYVNNKLKTNFFFIPLVWESLVLKGWSNNSIHLQLLLSLNISKVLLKTIQYSDRKCPFPKLLCLFCLIQFVHSVFLSFHACTTEDKIFTTAHERSLFHSKRNINMDLVHYFPVHISFKRNTSPHTQ